MNAMVFSQTVLIECKVSNDYINTDSKAEAFDLWIAFDLPSFIQYNFITFSNTSITTTQDDSAVFFSVILYVH